MTNMTLNMKLMEHKYFEIFFLRNNIAIILIFSIAVASALIISEAEWLRSLRKLAK